MTSAPRFALGLEQMLVDVAGLFEDAENLRLHDGKSIDAIVRSLKKFGQNKPIVVTRQGKVLAGNGTFRAARALQWPQIAAVRWFGQEDAARAFAIGDNRSAELSEWNKPNLAAQVAELLKSDIDLANALGFEPDEMRLLELSSRTIDEATAALPAAPIAEYSPSQVGQPPTMKLWSFDLEVASEQQYADWQWFLAHMKKLYPSEVRIGPMAIRHITSLESPAEAHHAA